MLYMLDTDTASDLIKDRSPGIKAKLAAIDPATICVSVITRAEILYGLKCLPPSHRLHLGVKRFLRIVHVMPWDADAADHYADIRHQFVTTGRPIGEMEMMIAAHSLSVGAALVTNNIRHFERVAPPLTLMNWAEP